MLVANHTFIDLAPAKPGGLNDLGVPAFEGTAVRKGRLGEFTQWLDDGVVGRMFQNLRVIAVRATEGGEVSARLFLMFEVFGDSNAPLAPPCGPRLRLLAGDTALIHLPPSPMFMPYACAWYENRWSHDVPLDAFEAADRVEFIVSGEAVRPV